MAWMLFSGVALSVQAYTIMAYNKLNVNPSFSITPLLQT